MLVMTNYAKNYASTIYQSLVCLYFLESILSDFERSLGFFYIGGGGRGIETENPNEIHR